MSTYKLEFTNSLSILAGAGLNTKDNTVYSSLFKVV